MGLNKVNLFLWLLLTGESVFAASGGGVPMGTVISQIINLGLLIGLLYFTQRKNISQAFKDKKNDFLKSVNEASASKQAAEAKLAEVTKRVNDLKNTYGEQVSKAQVDAEESYRDQLAKAKNEAGRLKSSAQTNLEFEVQRQIESLRVETFQKSANAAEKNLQQNLTSEQRKAWNGHFTAGKQGAH